MAVSRILVVASGVGTMQYTVVVGSCRPDAVGMVNTHAPPLASWAVERWDDGGSSCIPLVCCMGEWMDRRADKTRTRSSRILEEHVETGVVSPWSQLSDRTRPLMDGKGGDGPDLLEEDNVVVARCEEREPRGDAHVDSSLVRKAFSRSNTTGGALVLFHRDEHDAGEVVYVTIE